MQNSGEEGVEGFYSNERLYDHAQVGDEFELDRHDLIRIDEIERSNPGVLDGVSEFFRSCPIRGVFKIEKRGTTWVKQLVQSGDDQHDLISKLYRGVKNGDVEAVREAISRGVLQGTDPTKFMMEALSFGDPATVEKRGMIARILIASGADVNCGNGAPLWIALCNRDFETASLLIDRGARFANVDEAKSAFIKGSALRTMAFHGALEELAFLLTKNVPQAALDDALVHATAEGHADAVQLLLQHKADVHTDNKRPLPRGSAERI